MDKSRINLLCKHIDIMDIKLISMIESFKNYSEKTIPCVSVLCTENELRSEVDRLFTVREDMIVNSFVISYWPSLLLSSPSLGCIFLLSD